MKTILFIMIPLAVAIAIIALRQEKIYKGFKPSAKDGDGDGLVQDGTKWERKK
jgi:hypothetical protein